jgi:type I restriction enzyme S subunit
LQTARDFDTILEMKTQEDSTPALRFPEFTGEWARSEFSELAERSTAKFYPDEANDLSYQSVELESISPETGQLLTTFPVKDLKSVKNKFKKGEVLFGKLRPYLKKYLRAPFDGVCTSEIWVLKGKVISNDFLYNLVQSAKFNRYATVSSGSKMPRAEWDYVSAGLFAYPNSRQEEQKIAVFLSAVDATVGQLVRKKELLLEYKKGVMQQIFDQRVRFKDDNGNDFPEWDERRLGNLTTRVESRNRKQEALPVYSISNIHGFIPQSEQFDGVDSESRGYDISQYKIIENNTWAYNPARINVGSIGYSGEIGKVQISSLYVCFKTSDALNDAYLGQYFETRRFNNDVLRNVEGGVRDYLFYDNFSRINVPLPSPTEQEKIASFLSAIDKNIERADQQLEKTKTFKRGLLRQMFV